MKLSESPDGLLGAAAWGLREQGLEDQLRIVKDLGLDSLELGIANAPKDVPLGASEDERKAISELFSGYQIQLLGAATGNDFTVAREELPAQIEKVRQVTQLCATLNIPVVRIFCGFSKREEISEKQWENMINALLAVQKYAEELNVTLAFETHGAVEPLGKGVRHFRSATTQRSDVLSILEQTGHKIKLVFDPANLAAVGENDLAGFWNAVRKDVAYIHLKDFTADEQGALHPTAFGSGDTNWAELLPLLQKSGLPVFFEYEVCENVAEGLRECRLAWERAEKGAKDGN